MYDWSVSFSRDCYFFFFFNMQTHILGKSFLWLEMLEVDHSKWQHFEFLDCFLSLLFTNFKVKIIHQWILKISLPSLFFFYKKDQFTFVIVLDSFPGGFKPFYTQKLLNRAWKLCKYICGCILIRRTCTNGIRRQGHLYGPMFIFF